MTLPTRPTGHPPHLRFQSHQELELLTQARARKRQQLGGSPFSKPPHWVQPHRRNPIDVTLSIGFSRREYWNGSPLPSSEDLPDPGIKPGSLALQADSLPTELPGQPKEGRPGSESGGKIHSFLPGISMIVFVCLT